MPLPRPLLLSLSLMLACSAPAQAQLVEDSLPDMGSSADELISPADELRYARQMVAEMRHYGMLVEDPLVEDYLQDLGDRLAANSLMQNPSFTFFVLRSRAINAFATLGGHVAVNAGLVLTAEREDELAAVLAHEITHVSQRHIVRSVESATKDALPIALATLAALIAAEKAGGGVDATQAAITGGIALMQQRQINYTRANEHEADRIGIQILARSDFDPMAMADFFGRMLRADRARASQDVPEMLRSHPVTTTRISEAKDRAEGAEASRRGTVAPSRLPLNPVLPAGLRAVPGSAVANSGRSFAFARERLRVLSADSSGAALSEYRRRVSAGEALDDASRYGHALARSRHGEAAAALDALRELREAHPDFYWIDLALAEAEHRAGHAAEADRLFAALVAAQPGNRAIALAYAGALAERGGREHAEQARELLRPLLARRADDIALQRAFARASELAGDLVRAGEAHAEATLLSGRPEDALNQLQRLKDAQSLDYVQRARIDARIAAITPIVLELHAEGIRAGDRQRRMDTALQPLWPLSPPLWR